MFKNVIKSVFVIICVFLIFACSNVLLHDSVEEDFNNDRASTANVYFSNATQVADFVKSHGYKWEWSDLGNVNLVIIRGAGSGYKPSSSYYDNVYDDLFVVVTKSGAVYEYNRGNAEGTTWATKVNEYGYNKLIGTVIY